LEQEGAVSWKLLDLGVLGSYRKQSEVGNSEGEQKKKERTV
jgi:hypothetical protein